MGKLVVDPPQNCMALGGGAEVHGIIGTTVGVVVYESRPPTFLGNEANLSET